MQHTAPKQTKLLGVMVRGLGIVTAISQGSSWPYAMIEGNGKRQHVFFSQLTKDMIELPAAPQPFVQTTERIGYGLWDQVYTLASSAPVALGTAA